MSALPLKKLDAHQLPETGEILFSFGKNTFDNTPKLMAVKSFDELLGFIDSNRQSRKGLNYICAPLSTAIRNEKNGYRLKINVLPSRLLMVDIDTIKDPTILPELDDWFRGFKGVAWPTHSDTPDEPRRRGVLLVDRPINREEMARIGAALYAEILEHFGIEADTSVFKGEQPNYLAPVDAELIDLNGRELCADEWLAKPAAEEHQYKGADKTSVEQESEAAQNDPVFIRLLDRGLIKSKAVLGAYNIICPFACEHTTESGETSTQYYLPHTNLKPFGGFKCQHAHCQNRSLNDYLKKLELDPYEVYQQQRTGFTTISDEQVAQRRKEQREKSQEIGRRGTDGVPLQRLMALPQMLEELVFIADGARVSFVDNPRFVLPFSEFKQFTAGSTGFEESANGGQRKIHLLDKWREHPDRMTVNCQTFAPGRGVVCQSPENILSQNLWIDIKRNPPKNWQSLSKPFFDHIDYLVPIEEERERFLDWLAHIVQKPGELPSTHYLMVTVETGIGRNWMAYALARVFAGNTALGFDLGATLRSGFNGALSQTLLAVVDELHEGGPNAANKPQTEKLKSLLTEHTRNINPKFGRMRVEFNCCRFLMLSNHEAALPLSDNDRRVIVIQNPTERKSGSYYSKLYSLLENPDLGDAIAECLLRRDISKFNPGEIAPMNEAKRRAIRAGRSEIEQAIRDIAADWPSDCITAAGLNEEIQSSLGGRVNSTQGASVTAGLVKFGRVKVSGKSQHVWILRDFEKWVNAKPIDIAIEVIRGRDSDKSEGETALDARGSKYKCAEGMFP